MKHTHTISLMLTALLLPSVGAAPPGAPGGGIDVGLPISPVGIVNDLIEPYMPERLLCDDASDEATNVRFVEVCLVEVDPPSEPGPVGCWVVRVTVNGTHAPVAAQPNMTCIEDLPAYVLSLIPNPTEDE